MSLLWLVVPVLLLILFLVARKLHFTRERNLLLESRLASILAVDDVGLSVWSAEKRLIGCNSRFREFYPGTAIKLGLEYEDLIRYMATRGLIQIPENEIEHWIKGRISVAGTDSIEIVCLADSRWFEIRVLMVVHGEFLMLFRDVTQFEKLQKEFQDQGKKILARVNEREVLQKVIKASAGPGSFETLIKLTMELVCEWTSWSVGVARRVVGDEPDSFSPIVGIYFKTDSKEKIDLKELELREITDPQGNSLAKRVFQANCVVWIPNIDGDPTFSEKWKPEMLELRGACGVPVVHRGQMLVILEFFSSRPLVPSTSQTHLLESIASTLSSAAHAI